MFNRQDVLNHARSYKGARFKKCGRNKNALDCVGLLTLVAQDLGMTVDDVLNYDFEPKPRLFLTTIHRQTDPANLSTPQVGNIALLTESIFPMHCGIIGKNERGFTLIHANMRKRLVVEDPISSWRDKIFELRDYKGLVS